MCTVTPKWSCSLDSVQGTGPYRRPSLRVTTELCMTHGGSYLTHALIFLTRACSLCRSAWEINVWNISGEVQNCFPIIKMEEISIYIHLNKRMNPSHLGLGLLRLTLFSCPEEMRFGKPLTQCPRPNTFQARLISWLPHPSNTYEDT